MRRPESVLASAFTWTSANYVERFFLNSLRTNKRLHDRGIHYQLSGPDPSDDNSVMRSIRTDHN
jgi:hypothetical protein